MGKCGKWSEDEKADTRVPDTFEEWGEIPEEPGQGARSDIAELYSKIKAGMSNAEIMAANPDSAKTHLVSHTPIHAGFELLQSLFNCVMLQPFVLGIVYC